jgi:hypothetical protein
MIITQYIGVSAEPNTTMQTEEWRKESGYDVCFTVPQRHAEV